MCSFGQQLTRGFWDRFRAGITSPRCAEREPHFTVLHNYPELGGWECPIEIATCMSMINGYDESCLSCGSIATGLPYDRYVKTGTDEQQRRWSQVYDAARLSEAQKQLVGGFVRGNKILISAASGAAIVLNNVRSFTGSPKRIQERLICALSSGQGR